LSEPSQPKLVLIYPKFPTPEGWKAELVSTLSTQDRYVTTVTVVSCSSRRASLGNWSESRSQQYRLFFLGYLVDYLGYVTTTQVNSALHPFGVAKSSTGFGWGKGGKVTSAGWQVTLCDPIWHVISRSGEVKFTNCLYPSLPLPLQAVALTADPPRQPSFLFVSAAGILFHF